MRAHKPPTKPHLTGAESAIRRRLGIDLARTAIAGSLACRIWQVVARERVLVRG
jgi:hypothetical protein